MTGRQWRPAADMLVSNKLRLMTSEGKELNGIDYSSSEIKWNGSRWPGPKIEYPKGKLRATGSLTGFIFSELTSAQTDLFHGKIRKKSSSSDEELPCSGISTSKLNALWRFRSESFKTVSRFSISSDSTVWDGFLRLGDRPGFCDTRIPFGRWESLKLFCADINVGRGLSILSLVCHAHDGLPSQRIR